MYTSVYTYDRELWKASVCWGGYHAHPQGWTSSELKEFFTGLVLPAVCTCIYRACDADIKKGFRLTNLGKTYTPRWEKRNRAACCIPDCTEQSRPVIRNHPFAKETICSCVGVLNLQYRSGTSELPLCASHYQLVYHLCNPDKVCKICGSKRKHERILSASLRFVTCPEPKKVESFLQETADFNSSHGDDDLICYSCYKYVNLVLRSNVCMLSSEAVVQELHKQQESLQSQISSLSSTHKRNKCISSSASIPENSITCVHNCAQ